MAKIKPEFDRRNTKIIGLSVDSTGDHEGWATRHRGDPGAPRPTTRSSATPTSRCRSSTACCPPRSRATRRRGRRPTTRRSATFRHGPGQKVKLVLVYPMTTGRNFDEVLRVIDSLQLTAKHKRLDAGQLAARRQGDHRRLGLERRGEGDWPDGWEEPKPYIRIVPQPQLTPQGTGSRLHTTDGPGWLPMKGFAQKEQGARVGGLLLLRRNFGPGGSACGRGVAPERYLFHIVRPNERFFQLISTDGKPQIRRSTSRPPQARAISRGRDSS